MKGGHRILYQDHSGPFDGPYSSPYKGSMSRGLTRNIDVLLATGFSVFIGWQEDPSSESGLKGF